MKHIPEVIEAIVLIRHHPSLYSVPIILLCCLACIRDAVMPDIYFENEVGYDEILNISDVGQMS